ncbi:MAG: F0F1 ATP synthase subunit B [Culicoidibacterales bacterium]
MDINFSLNFDILTFVLSLGSTAILFYFMFKLLWQPLQNYLERRQQYVVDQIAQADVQNQEASETNTEAQKRLRRVQEESTEILESARVRADQTATKMQEELQVDLRKRREAFDAQLEIDQQLAQKELKDQAIDLSVVIASQLLSEQVDEANTKARALAMAEKMVMANGR